jgi:undecaprenyl diphosphate synthase
MSHDPRAKIKDPPVPTHVAIILDGNRRWAKKHGKKTLDGHRRGAEVFRELSLYLFEKQIPYVTAYIFSKENWKRAEEEVSYLMRLVLKAVELHLDEFHQHNIQIRVIGERDQLSKPVLQAIERTEEKTADNSGAVLTLCLNYGGKEEIVRAAQQLVEKGVAITEESIRSHVYAPDIPDVDLMIRTSGEHRISGFMLWRSEYAEMYFTDTLWPDMKTIDMDAAIDDYACRQRRFGR